MKKETKNKIKKEIIIWLSVIIGSFLVLTAVFMFSVGWEFVGPFLKDKFTVQEKKQEEKQEEKQFRPPTRTAFSVAG